MSNPRPPRRPRRVTRGLLCVLTASAGAVLVGVALLRTPDPHPGDERWLTPVAFEPQREARESEESRESIVTFRDGTTLRGELVHRDAAEVVLRIRGVTTTYPAARVRSIQFLDPIMERYREMRAAIDDYEADQLVVLIDWLTANGAHSTALQEAEALLRRVPGQPEIIQRLPLLRAQARLAENWREQLQREREERERPGNRRERNGFPVLSPEQINLLKVYEIDLADPPRIRIRRETVQRLIQNYADARGMPTTPEALQALYRARPERILELMFRVQARDLYAEVEVVGEPEAFQRFRRDVHAGWLFRGCATNDCHGGQEAGRFMLRGQHPNRDETVYTNFFIVENFRFDDGEPLIDYENPEQSRLLQLALPRETSKFPHPRIVQLDRERPWRPLLRSPEDPRFRDSVRWINSMYRPRPDYPITFELPEPKHDLYKPSDEPPGPR